MGVLSVILYTVAVIIAILLICLVLVQPSKGGGLGSAFGGAGEAVFGAQTMNHLSKLTVVLIAIFFAVTLALAAISGNRTTAASTADKSAVVSGKDTEEKKEEVKGVALENKAPAAVEMQEVKVTPDAQEVKKAPAAKDVKKAPAKKAEKAPAKPQAKK
ncbi:MAG: preprotein translocase subunit SecG [Lentisphaerae bacterium]|nr:preprotein translocase subunit SecG [Lentisphaerota bacterium]